VFSIIFLFLLKHGVNPSGKIFITTFFLSVSSLLTKKRGAVDEGNTYPASSLKHAAKKKKKNEHDFRTNIIEALELNNFLMEEIHLL
jgi:hypothetical protein